MGFGINVKGKKQKANGTRISIRGLGATGKAPDVTKILGKSTRAQGVKGAFNISNKKVSSRAEDILRDFKKGRR